MVKDARLQWSGRALARPNRPAPAGLKAGRSIATVALLVLMASVSHAQVAMPDFRQMSGVPLPASDLPGGTVSVRVIRGSFANNIADATVEFTADGKVTTAKTDAGGRAQTSGLKPGTRFKAATVVDGERLETQEVTIGASGIRFVLAAAAGSAPAGASAAAAGPAVKGSVVLGANSRIVAEFSNDQLNLSYAIEIVNNTGAPVDTGGPLIFELPQGARGVGMLAENSPQVTPQGAHVIATGPFPPGTTRVNVGFELPYSGGTALVEQRWPAALDGVSVFALKTGDMDITSTQLPNKQLRTMQGLTVIATSGPAVPLGQSLAFEISGLPHHPSWPRYIALTLAGVIVVVGLWTGFTPSSRRAASEA